MLDGHFVAWFVQVPKELASNVRTRTVEPRFMYVSSVDQESSHRAEARFQSGLSLLCRELCLKLKTIERSNCLTRATADSSRAITSPEPGRCTLNVFSVQVTCGLSAGYFLDVQQTASKETTSSRSQFNAYCLKHSNEARQRSEPEMSSNDADATADCSSTIPFTVYHRQVLKNEQWLGQCLGNFANFVSSLHLNEQCPQDYDLILAEKIYVYWKEKRQGKNNLPLIPRIDFVLEQRENAELLLAQINHCLKLRRKIRQVAAGFSSAVSLDVIHKCKVMRELNRILAK